MIIVGKLSANVCWSLNKIKKLSTNASTRQMYEDSTLIKVFETVFNIPTYNPSSVDLPIINIINSHVMKRPYAQT